MRETNDLRKGKKFRCGSAKQIMDPIYEPDRD